MPARTGALSLSQEGARRCDTRILNDCTGALRRCIRRRGFLDGVQS